MFIFICLSITAQEVTVHSTLCLFNLVDKDINIVHALTINNDYFKGTLLILKLRIRVIEL